MGVYFNPSNESFKQAKNSLVYVDKTGLLEMLNKKISTEDKCILDSRPNMTRLVPLFQALHISLPVC